MNGAHDETAAKPTVALRERTAAIAWFTVVVFAYYYKVVLCGVFGHTLGWSFVCDPYVHGITLNHWIETLVYCPLLWLGLHQVNTDVFGDVPSDPRALRTHRRRQLIGEGAIAVVLYGTGVHIANVIEINSRERQDIATGPVYDLVKFLDEGLSHYLQFVPLFFVIGWFIVNDRPGRTGHATWALFMGVGHGVERAVGIIEGGKWFLGPPTVLWLVLAVTLRVRRRGGAAWSEFFVRYAVAFCVALPSTQLAYRLRFGAFTQPSALGEAKLTQLAIGGATLTIIGTALAIAADQRWVQQTPLTTRAGR